MPLLRCEPVHPVLNRCSRNRPKMAKNSPKKKIIICTRGAGSVRGEPVRAVLVHISLAVAFRETQVLTTLVRTSISFFPSPPYR